MKFSLNALLIKQVSPNRFTVSSQVFGLILSKPMNMLSVSGRMKDSFSTRGTFWNQSPLAPESILDLGSMNPTE